MPVEPTIIYEDQDVIVVNKPAGLPVHSDGRHERATLVAYLASKMGTTPAALVGAMPFEVVAVKRDDKPMGAVLYTNLRPPSIEMACAGEPGHAQCQAEQLEHCTQRCPCLHRCTSSAGPPRPCTRPCLTFGPAPRLEPFETVRRFCCATLATPAPSSRHSEL